MDLARTYLVTTVHMSEAGNKLMSMGVLPGTKIELLRLDPWGHTYYLKADGQAIALRKNEIATLEMTEIG